MVFLGGKSKRFSKQLKDRVSWCVILIPVGVVLFSVLVASLLRATKQQAVINPDEERVWAVETTSVQIGDERPNVHLFGKIIAGRQANLRSLSAGVVVSVSSNFIDGGKVVEGEKLIAIAPFVAERKLLEQEALLSEAKSRYEELLVTRSSDLALLGEEQQQLDIAQSDLSRYEELESGVASIQKVDEKRLGASQAKGVVLSRQQRVSVLNTKIEQQQAVIDRHDGSR